MTKKTVLASNACIAVVLIGLSVAIFTADITGIFISVMSPVYQGRYNKISLLFVVEDDARFVDEIADLLHDRNVPAVFFIGGNWANNNRDKASKIAENFVIGNHGFYHRPLARMNERDQFAEIERAHNTLYDVTRRAPTLFLPPFGSFNARTLRASERFGYRAVMWSRDATTQVIYDRAVYGISGGEFVVFRANLSTFASLGNILRAYEQMGLEIICVCENI